jgi:ActR/RegA family two-component response regulator
VIHPNAPPVLLLTGDAALRRGLSGQSRMLGYKPLEASSGAEAAARLRQNPDVHAAIVELPGDEGLAAVALLKRIAPGIRCCLVTGATPPVNDLANGAVDWALSRPFSLSEVSSCLRRLAPAEDEPPTTDWEPTKRIRSLQAVCAWCGRMRDPVRQSLWSPPPPSSPRLDDNAVTHGVCPSCATALMKEAHQAVEPLG